MGKKEKESVLDFHGKRLLEVSGLSYADIEKNCGRDGLQYRTIYSFFELNDGKAKVETAAQIAIAMKASLNDLYSPKGSTWQISNAPLDSSEGKEANCDLQIIINHLPKETRSKLALDLINGGYEELGEYCNQLAIDANAADSTESDGEQDG